MVSEYEKMSTIDEIREWAFEEKNGSMGNAYIRIVFEEFETKLTRQAKVVEAAQQIYDAADIKGDKECPHGNSAAYPVHGWFCDNCFFQLKEALEEYSGTEEA